MQWKVQLCELNYGKEELEAVSSVLANEWLTMGEKSAQFEEEMQRLIDHPNPGIFVSSATAGLHLILMSLGIGAGDEVIIPGLTFISDANVIAQLGADIVLADSNSVSDFNVSEADILSKISSRTKAIVIVHFAGYPIRLNTLREVAASLSIPIIEDCAHAPGACIDGQMCGNLADYSFFSFFSNKNLAVGEGGMVFAKNPNCAEKIRQMRSHGMTAVTLDRHKGRASSYDVIHVGLNYRADEMRAVLGIEQLKKLKNGNSARETLTARYRANLAETDVIVPFLHTEKTATSAYHILPIIIPINVSQFEILEQMRNYGVQCSIHYPAIHKFTIYQEHFAGVKLPVVEEISLRELTLPLHPRMSLQDVDYVTEKLMGALKQ